MELLEHIYQVFRRFSNERKKQNYCTFQSGFFVFLFLSFSNPYVQVIQYIRMTLYFHSALQKGSLCVRVEVEVRYATALHLTLLYPTLERITCITFLPNSYSTFGIRIVYKECRCVCFFLFDIC